LSLDKSPEITAKELFQRLQSEYPDRFTDGQLRTLQRRIREWRQVMAKKLVNVCVNDKSTMEESGVLDMVGAE
jgi:hypothetical protein